MLGQSKKITFFFSFSLVMSKLEKAIVAIVEVFEEFAGTDDDKKKQSNAELSALLSAQLSSPEFKVNIKHSACTVQYTASMKQRFRYSFTLRGAQ